MSTPAKTVIALAVIAAAFLAGSLVNRRVGPTAHPTSARQVLYYTCPMHPQYKSDRPGDAPCCGMRLEPVYAGGATAGLPDSVMPGAVEVSPAKQQVMGVRLGTVEKSAFSYAMRYPGRVAVDETRVHRWNAAVNGWIRSLSPHSTGSLVKKGELLATYYAPEFLGAQQAYLFGLNSWDRFKADGIDTPEQTRVAKVALQQSSDNLRNLGMSETQIEEMAKRRATTENINIYCPVTGFMIARDVSPGQRFERGSELYRFADLGHVWVLADVFEKDRELIRAGAAATVRYQGRGLQARMSDVLPQFDETTRTLKTRFELDNPELVLRPNMFVDVELQMDLAPTLHIPVEAVLDTGARKTVYVDRGNGFFEPRQVGTGWRLGDRVEITRGLAAGERIVVSGNFLIDSDSRMKLAGSRASAASVKDLVCNMDVDPGSPKALKAEHAGKTYYFCSDQCRKSFQENPGKYVPEQRRPGARGPA